VFLLAGEPSGDALGAQLMRGLKRLTEGHVRFAGIGGELMTAEGLESLFPMTDLAVIGLVEVLPRARLLMRRIRETADAIATLNPDVAVSVDSPGFTYRVATRLRRRGATVPLVHYVAPQVWAWRPKRARETAQLFDHLMALLPFEPPLFESAGLPTTYVGHPALENATQGDGPGFRRRHGIPADATVLGMLPGSRWSELERLLPVFEGAVRRLRPAFSDLHVVMPTIGAFADMLTTRTASWPVPTTVVTAFQKNDSFAAMDAAAAASGTVTLELAIAGVPFVTTYKVTALTAWLVRRLIKIDYVTMANVILERSEIPELLQEDCTPERLATAVRALLRDSGVREAQRQAFAEVRCRLHQDDAPPSERAAAVVLDVIGKARARR
jgi:lipid-A-disaccharide synthase